MLYYTTTEQLHHLLAQLDPEGSERELCDVFRVGSTFGLSREKGTKQVVVRSHW